MEGVRFANPLTGEDEQEDPLPSHWSSDMLHSMLSMDADAKQIDHEAEREREQAKALDYMEEHSILSPDGTIRQQWDIVQVPLLTYVAVLIPYRIGFSHDTEPGDFGFILDVFIDMFFIVDIYLNFRTAVWNQHGTLTYEPKGIAMHYLKGWFIVDVLGCLPINYVLLVIDPHAASDSSAGRGNKVFRVLRLFKLLKLLRLARLQRIVKRYQEQFYTLASGFALAKILLVVGTIGHWLACLWFGIGSIPDETALQVTGERRLTWTEVEFGEFVCADSSTIAGPLDYVPYDPDAPEPCAEDLPCTTECAVHRRLCTAVDECSSVYDDGVGQRWSRYITALYWAFMTMTTVGYGDIPAGTYYEKITATFGMLVGGFTFGLIVGRMGEMARKANPGDAFRTKTISQLSAYLSRREVTPDLVRRIRLYFQNHYETSSVFAQKEYEEYFMRLPADLRSKLCREIGYATTDTTPGMLGQVSCFAELDMMSIALLCGRIKTAVYPKSFNGDGVTRETIIRKGEVAQDMVLMLDGRMNITDSEAESDVDQFVHHDEKTAADWHTILDIGKCLDDHVCVLPPYQLHYRTITGYAQIECSIGLLSAEDVAHVSRHRPQVRRHVKAQAEIAKQLLTRRKVSLLFKSIDADGSGDVDFGEFCEVMQKMGQNYEKDELLRIFQEIDTDEGGTIDAKEFADWYIEEEKLQKKLQKRQVGVDADTIPMTYSPRARQTATKQEDDDIDKDAITRLSRSGEQVNMVTLREDFIELDRIASKLQADFERVVATVDKKMGRDDDQE